MVAVVVVDRCSKTLLLSEWNHRQRILLPRGSSSRHIRIRVVRKPVVVVIVPLLLLVMLLRLSLHLRAVPAVVVAVGSTRSFSTSSSYERSKEGAGFRDDPERIDDRFSARLSALRFNGDL